MRQEQLANRAVANPSLFVYSCWRGSTGIDGQPVGDPGPSRPGSMPLVTAGTACPGPIGRAVQSDRHAPEEKIKVSKIADQLQQVDVR